jgi:hypothetical protein
MKDLDLFSEVGGKILDSGFTQELHRCLNNLDVVEIHHHDHTHSHWEFVLYNWDPQYTIPFWVTNYNKDYSGQTKEIPVINYILEHKHPIEWHALESLSGRSFDKLSLLYPVSPNPTADIEYLTEQLRKLSPDVVIKVSNTVP